MLTVAMWLAVSFAMTLLFRDCVRLHAAAVASRSEPRAHCPRCKYPAIEGRSECSECGARYALAGLATPELMVRAGSSMGSLSILWTILVLVLCSVFDQFVARESIESSSIGVPVNTRWFVIQPTDPVYNNIHVSITTRVGATHPTELQVRLIRLDGAEATLESLLSSNVHYVGVTGESLSFRRSFDIDTDLTTLYRVAGIDNTTAAVVAQCSELRQFVRLALAGHDAEAPWRHLRLLQNSIDNASGNAHFERKSYLILSNRRYYMYAVVGILVWLVGIAIIIVTYRQVQRRNHQVSLVKR